MSEQEHRQPDLRLLPPLMLTPDDVARRFSVSVTTVHRWIASGRLRAFRSGRVVRIYGDSVAEALRCGRLPGATA